MHAADRGRAVHSSGLGVRLVELKPAQPSQRVGHPASTTLLRGHSQIIGARTMHDREMDESMGSTGWFGCE